MFRRYYKQANDDIKPDRELIDKIFEKAKSLPEMKPRVKIYKIGTAVAAVFVVAVSVFLYPQIEKTNHQPIVAEIKSNVKSENDSAEIRSLQPQTQPQEDSIENVGTTTEKAVSENSRIAPAPAGETQQGIETFDMAKRENIENGIHKQNIDNIAEIEEAEKKTLAELLYANFGLIDEATGNQHIFEITGKFNINIDNEERTFYVGRWRWFVNGDHSSLLCEFVVDESVTQMYECQYEDGNIIWDETANLLQ